MADHGDSDKPGLAEARPASGDLVDRVLEAKVRTALFGLTEEIKLGRLRVEGVLGRGGMGAIVSAFDPVLDRSVAVKTLHPSSGDRDELLREARMLAKLSHANIVPVYDVIDADGELYLVMERVDGGDLRAWLAAGARSWREVVALFVQIGNGLAAAHALGIVHCDVKPENVVVSEGRPRLIDFGLASRTSDASSQAGTRAYFAPERVAGQGGSTAADQYAFFASLAEAIERVRAPAWLAKVVRRGLSEDPAKRYPSMTAAVGALARMSPIVKAAVAVVVVMVAALIGVIVVQRATAGDPRCEGSAAQVARAWSPARRFATTAAFVATGAAKADAIAARAGARLDRYAGDWVRLRTNSCVATRVHQTQSEALLDGSMACFDRQLVALGGIAELFEHPDPKIVARADATLGELGNLASCTDPTTLAQAVALPSDRARLGALDARFEVARNLERRGDHKAALAAADALLSDVESFGYAPLTAQVQKLRGAIQVTLGDLKTAEATFRAAATAGAQAHDDKLVAEVWTRVLDLLAQQGRFDEALTLEPVAQTSAERVAGELAVAARLANTLGGIYLAKGRYPESYRAYAKAFALQQKIGADGNPAYTPALANLALAKWYAGDPRSALTDLEAALVRMTAELGPDHSSLAYVHENLADIAHQLGDTAKAIPHYREAIRIWSASLGATHPNLAYPYEQLALVGKDTRDFATARSSAARALELRDTGLGPDHPLVAQTLTVVAEVELADGSPEAQRRAESAIVRALGLLDKLGEAGRRQRPYVLEARAHLADLRRDFPAALRDRRAALAIVTALLGPDHADTVRARTAVADAEKKSRK